MGDVVADKSEQAGLTDGDILMEQEKTAEQIKQEQIKQEVEKAEKDLTARTNKENKVNQGFLSVKEFVEVRGYSKNPDAERRSLERLSGVGFCFVMLAVAIGIIMMTVGGGLGQAGMLFNWIQTIGEGVGLFVSVVAFVSSIIVIVVRKNKVWGGLVTSAAALLLYIVYKVILFVI